MSGPRVDASTRLSGWRAAVVWFPVATGLIALLVTTLFGFPLLFVAMLVAAVASFGGVGSLLAIRLPGNPIGWILWVAAWTIAWSITMTTYATYSMEHFGGSLPGTVPLAFISYFDQVPVVGAVGIFVPLLFPDGHLPSPRWRGVAWFAVMAIALTAVFEFFTPGPMGGSTIDNPIGSAAVPALQGTVGVALIVSLGLSFLLAVASVVWRFRHGTRVERQQLRWFGCAALVMAVAVALSVSNVGPFVDAGWLVLIGGLALLPIATGVAVLRYRLYDLDRLVSRTISYAVVTGLLVATYAMLILVLEGPLGMFANGNTLTVAISTLAVAALFAPIRRRVQRVVDRRFDRARYDAERLTVAFADRLRDGVDLSTVGLELDATVRGAIAPSSVGLWLRGGRQ